MKLSDAIFLLNMGFRLDASTEFEHPSRRYKTKKYTLREACCIISMKYEFQPMTKHRGILRRSKKKANILIEF
jgi:hypothetical protein